MTLKRIIAPEFYACIYMYKDMKTDFWFLLFFVPPHAVSTYLRLNEADLSEILLIDIALEQLVEVLQVPALHLLLKKRIIFTKATKYP